MWSRSAGGGKFAVETASAARSAGAKELAAQLLRYEIEGEELDALVEGAFAEGDIEFVEMIFDLLTPKMLSAGCAQMAKGGQWEKIEAIADRLDAELIEMLVQTAIEMGDFDAIDRMDALLNQKEEEQK